jgi:hypothetical protein
MLEIPLRSDLPHFDVQAVLDDVTFTLEFRWNTREGFWYMSILTDGGDPIITSIKCVVDWPLGRRTPDPRRPRGVLSLIDTSGGQVDPSFDPDTGKGDLGDRVQLLYFEAAELPAV